MSALHYIDNGSQYLPVEDKLTVEHLLLDLVTLYWMTVCSITSVLTVSCGTVAEWLGCWTYDQQVAGSNPSLPAIEYNPGKVINTHVPLSLSSIIWYEPMGSDALRLGR